jgi:hypothetical protein
MNSPYLLKEMISKMGGPAKELRVDRAESPVKEIWSRLSFFESEYNSKEFLKKFSLADDDLGNLARNLAFTMRTAREYYEAADRTTILTQPLLVFYGMTALAKTLFMSTHGKKSPSTKHGLQKVKEWTGAFAELSVDISKDGTFPQFHGCYSKENFYKLTFSMKELMSLVPEVKVEFETVYNEKSRAVRILKNGRSVHVVDSELNRYVDLAKQIFSIPGVNETYLPHAQEIGNKLILHYSGINPQAKDPAMRAVTGEEYLVLPLNRNGNNVSVPEMSIHFLIMYLLGMLSRYQPEEWGEIIKGEETGEIYIVRKFLETTTRKFPNLVLNELRNRNFVFVSPSIEPRKGLDDKQLEEIYDYVNRKLAEELRRI